MHKQIVVIYGYYLHDWNISTSNFDPVDNYRVQL